jgi:hypothetical protein
MTYIDTSNMRVQDAFIYLATGSVGSSDSGIVFHGGAGAGMDLVIGQHAGAGEVIFGKQNRSPDGNGDMTIMPLVAAWMNEVKFASVEGAANAGSLAFNAGDMKLSASAALKLQAGSELFNFADAGDQLAFETEFGAGKSIIGAIVDAASGGNFKQGSFLPGVKASGAAIPLPAGFSLRDGVIGNAAMEEYAMDVYLNGVRLAYGADYSISSKSAIALQVSTMADDRIMFVIHNAAA